MNNTLHTPKSLWHTTKKVARFTWRHLLTLCVFGMMVAALLHGKISWVNCFYFYVGAICLDWIKCLKGKGLNNSHEDMLAYARAQSSPNAMQSTQAWSSDPFAPGSSAYTIRQSRINGY